MKLYIVNKKPEVKDQSCVYFTPEDNDIKDLSKFFDDGELTYIFADCLGRLPLESIEKTIENWLTKLKNGGILEVIGVDARILAKLFVKDIVTLGDFNNYVLSNLSCLTLHELQKLLWLKNCKTLEKGFKDYTFSIKVEKIGHQN